MKTNEKRLFTAIELPGSWLGAIELTCVELKRQGVRGRFVPPERLHLTLNFLGETKREDQIADLLMTLDRSVPPLVRAGEGGLFRRRRGGDLIVWHLRPDEALKAYRKAETEALSAIGFKMDQRPYAPHLTLARDAEGAFLNTPAFITVFDRPLDFMATEVVLFWSRYVRRRLVYTPLGRFPFGSVRGEK
ncbi:MAG: RNA 2',3'-cyclic phosphodiesterase [Clostridiaceae bacterium]|nr:RNA 2',3'-cyclic phosphodiesterase [Clostridiaceae bacterium]